MLKFGGVTVFPIFIGDLLLRLLLVLSGSILCSSSQVPML